ncbi:HepT-like ribonuclease domain-containing protein [Alkalinema sp. FACHB-956]|uniref:HepT-like ribonuclease domain-containing protein n=1 Tax=Alkalinema sp. FACHB-956 TaxID=2692768 RepID=UPI0018F04B8E|nr:HepT-like ribonuclease domain-containing protein [Alkalinema sp. FACHB-956]
MIVRNVDLSIAQIKELCDRWRITEFALFGSVLRNDFQRKDVIGMRNILIHQYDQVDTEVIWDAICQDIPELISLIQPLL